VDIFNLLTWPFQLWIPVIQRVLIALAIVLLIVLVASVNGAFNLRKVLATSVIGTVVGVGLGSIIVQGYALTAWQREAQARLESRELNALELYPASSTVKLDIEGCVFTAKLWLDSNGADFATEPDVWEYLLTDSTESLQEHCE